MQPKQFNMLALSAVISLIAAGVVHSSYNSWTDDTVTGQRLFPTLETQGDSTAHILIQQGEDKLTLKKSADGKVWSMVERDGYPVDATKVRELVVKLGQTELIERKTNSEKLYGQLDLADPKAKSADSKLVRLGDKDNKTIAEVVIGKERRGAFGAGKAGTYVRVPGDKQTWLAQLELNASTSVDEWVKPVFFKFDEKKMSSLQINAGDAVVYKLAAKPKKPGEFELADVPAGKKQNAKLRIDDLINGIRTLEMVDVRKAGADDAKPDMTADVTMADGAKFRVGMKRDDKKRWMTVAVLANGKDEKTSKSLAAASKGWAFQIADWRADQTFKKPDEVYEAVKAEAPKASTAPNTAQPLGPRVVPGPANAGAPKSQ